MIFTAPLVLVGLAALPGLYFLLRLTPPAAQRIKFPPLALLRGLAAPERTPRNMPLWLLLLRLAAAALVIFGLAGPALHPPPALPGSGPVLLVIDNGWASAADWPERRAAALQLVAAAGRAGRGVALLATARGPGNAAPQVQGVLVAAQARQLVAALQPEPWPVDRAGAAAALRAAPPATRIYIADGLATPGLPDFLRALRPARIISAGLAATLLLPPVLTASGDLQARLAAGPADARVLAETAAGDVLASAPVSPAGAAVISLPLALQNRVARLVLAGPPTAGGTVLLDGAAHGALVGLAAGSAQAQSPYLGALFFARRALPAGAQVVTGDLQGMIDAGAGAIILADQPLGFAQVAAARQFVAAGGVLVRFAGPLTAEAPDGLAPDALLAGDRRLGGALTWTAPQALAPFADDTPFDGIAVDAGATVARQVLADPTQLDAGTVWATLRDGTPLVLGAAQGKGFLVSVLTTANADWSNLALSGMYPAMLARLVGLSRGAPPKPDQALPAVMQLGAFGRLAPADAAASITAAGLADAQISPRQPPGLYGGGASTLALNLGGHVPPPVPADLAGAVPLGAAPPPVDLGAALIAAALALVALDLCVSLWLRGLLRRRWPRRLPALAALAAALAAPAAGARAQTAALATTLAYVITGDPAADQLSADGLGYLSAEVSAHSSAQLAGPAGVRPGVDDLSLYPLLYWPVLPAAPAPSPAACAALTAYMQNGGLLVIDSPGGETAAPGSGAGFAPGAAAARGRATACLALPPLEPLTPANVLAHCFYIVQDFPGRFAGAPVLVASAAARDADGVTPVIIGQNDWAGAWARDAVGNAEQTPIPGGDDQRVTADRFGTNLVIYALTGSYKADQANLPGLLDRLGQ
jgi:hypothetical protein